MTTRGIVPAAAITYASFALPISMLGVIWPDVRADFGQSLGTLGLVSLIYGLARMASATTGRPLVTRIGTGRAFVLTLLLLGASCVLLASAPSWAVFLVAMGGVGLVSGMIDSIGAVFIATLGEVGSAGLIHGFYGFGATLGPLVVAGLPGWRWPIAAALVGVGLALVATTLVRDRWPAVEESGVPTTTTGESAVTPPQPTGATSARIAASLVVFATFVAVEVTTGQWVFTYLTDGRGLGDDSAAFAVSAFWAGLMTGRLLMAGSGVSRLVVRIGLAPLAATGAIGILAIIVLPANLAIAPLVVAGVALAPIVPTLFATTALRVGTERASTIAGWQLISTNVGAISVPALTGVLVDGSGPAIIVAVIVVCVGVIGTPLLFGLDRRA